MSRTQLAMTGSSLAAGGLALGLMLAARAALQIRSLPERIMEAALVLVSPDQFESAVEKYGPAAKEYALYATSAVMLAALVAIGLLAHRCLRRPEWLLALGMGLWLAGMLVIMPLTGGGIFATGLFQNPVLVNAVYLGIGLAYASVLLLGRMAAGPWLPARQASEPGFYSLPARRAFLAGTAGTLASLAVTVSFGKSSTRVASSLPLASLPPAEAGQPSPVATGEPAAPSPAAAAGSVSPSPAAAGEGQGEGPRASAAPSTAPSTVASQQSASQSPSAASPSAAPPSASSTPSAPPTAQPVVFPSPPPERPLPRDKDGALLAVNKPKGQLQPAVTPNDDWYVVTKNAGGDPRLDARDWRLIVDGSVNRPVQLDYQTLVKLSPVSMYKTLECISNLTAKCELTSFGCDLTSTAKWTGARLPDVVALAGGLKPGVVALAAVGADEFSSALPASAASDPEVIVAYMMNDAVLPREHGFPARILIPDRYGVKDAKWIVNLKLMTQAYVDWYGQRNWSQTAIVKTMSRIDVPAPGAKVPPGDAQIAGIAYAGARGIAKVEFSADGGETWQPAKLEPPLGRDTFIRWTGAFQIAAGQTLQLVSRATDGTGALQTDTFNLPQPNGGTGWNSISVSA